MCTLRSEGGGGLLCVPPPHEGSIVLPTGFKLRKRRIANEPTGGTGNCPHLVEAIPCEEPVCFDWLLAALEECVPDNERPCGPGTQNPRVQCVDSDGEESAAATALVRDDVIVRQRDRPAWMSTHTALGCNLRSQSIELILTGLTHTSGPQAQGRSEEDEDEGALQV